MPSSQMLVLVGIPGSGKTMFAKKLCEYFPTWHRICQDEMGSRPVCEGMATKHLKGGHNVVIDRCNFDEDQRRVWIEIADKAGATVDALYFDTPVKVCKERVKERVNHPTGVEGKFGVEVVIRFERITCRPTTYEGFRFVNNIDTFLRPKPPPDPYTKELIKAILDAMPPKKDDRPPASTPPPRPPPDLHSSYPPLRPRPPPATPPRPPPTPPPAGRPVPPRPEDGLALWPKPPEGWYSRPMDSSFKWDLSAPVEGFGTFKESRGTWEDESHNKHWNHSLYNEQADHDKTGGRDVERHTRHFQHSDHIRNDATGVRKSFDYLSLDRHQDGSEIDKNGTKVMFNDNSEFFQQDSHEVNPREGSERRMQQKSVQHARTKWTADNPRSKRAESFEHRSYDYHFKGKTLPADPKHLFEAAIKHKAEFHDEIKSNFAAMPVKTEFHFNQSVDFKSDFPPQPNIPFAPFFK